MKISRVLMSGVAAALLAGGFAFTTAAPAVATENQCAGLSTGKINTGEPNPATVPYTAPAGKLVSQYCVKSGSVNQGDGPIYVPVNPPAASIVIDYPNIDSVSHYSVLLVDIPGPEWKPPSYPPFDPKPCTEYRLEKSTSTWNGQTGTWSAWTDLPDVGPLAWGDIPSPRTGHYGGTHEADGDQHYAYVVVDSRPLTTGECAPHATATASYTPPTCAAPGTVTLSSGVGYTWTDSGSDLAKIYTAVPTGDYVLDGQTVFGPWRIAQLTTEDTRSCLPEKPSYPPLVEITDGVCTTPGQTTITVTTTTTTYVAVWNGSAWVKTVATGPTETTEQRKLDEKDDIDGCTPTRADKVVTTSGTPACGDTTVSTLTTTTPYVFTYDFETGTWDEGVLSEVSTVEPGTRPLTTDELAALERSCTDAPDPAIEIRVECGSYAIELSNDVSPPQGHSAPAVTFLVTIDGVTTEHTVQPQGDNEASTAVLLTDSFEEDSGDVQISVQIKGSDAEPETATVETDCTTAPAVAALPPILPTQTPVPPPPTTTTTVPPTTTVAPPTGQLPVTGGAPWTTLWIALASIGAGLLVVRTSRRSAR
jgi:hypothetical protein